MKRSLIFALLFTAVYLALFPSQLRKEPVFKPAWVDDLTRPRAATAAAGVSPIGFRMGNAFGYVDPDGGIRYLNSVQFDVAMDGERFINFSSVSQNLVMRDDAGRIISSVASEDYPILLAGRYFTIDSDRTQLSELNGQGDQIWIRNFGTIVTCLDATKSLLAVGLLDGTLDVVDPTGRLVQSYRPGGSKVPVVYGCAIGDDGATIALISGIGPQELTLLHKDSTGYRPTKVVTLPTDFRGRVHLQLMPAVPYVYFEGRASAGYVPKSSGKAVMFPFSNQESTVVGGPSRFLLYGGTGDQTIASPTATFAILAPPRSEVFSVQFPGSHLALKTVGSDIYLGVDTMLAKLTYAKD